MALKSTCPCNFTLHYEVASRGNIVLSGKEPANTTASHRGKRATVTFDKNIHTTPLPSSASGRCFSCVLNFCLSNLFNEQKSDERIMHKTVSSHKLTFLSLCQVLQDLCLRLRWTLVCLIFVFLLVTSWRPSAVCWCTTSEKMARV